MILSFVNLGRFFSFLQNIHTDVYPEAPSEIHDAVTERAFNHLLESYPFPAHAAVLDVGCGQGVALDRFRSHGLQVTGVNIDEEDIAICRSKGHRVFRMDQSFLDFPDGSFDLVWARHVIEHSVFPYYTLVEFARVLRPGGIIYLEMPAAETTCQHELNPNHYSILSHSMWLSLLERAGIPAVEMQKYYLKTTQGPDEYWGFYAKKSEQSKRQ